MKRWGTGICIALLAGAAWWALNDAAAVDRDGPAIRVIFSFNPESYPRMIRKMYPQMAVWATGEGTDFTRTLYATKSGARDKWWGADKRPSALPVWYGIMSAGGTGDIDAVTGATPSGESFSVRWPLPRELRGKTVNIFIEANVSFDYNERYPKKAKEGDAAYSGVNGQPSLVWKARIDTSKGQSSVTPVLAGHGEVLGRDHRINEDLAGITTARGLFHYIKVVFEPGR